MSLWIECSPVLSVASQSNTDLQSEDWSLCVATIATYSGTRLKARITRYQSRSEIDRRALAKLLRSLRVLRAMEVQT